MAVLSRLSIDSVKWEEFFIGGENGLFRINSTKSGIDKNKIIEFGGCIPYITRSSINNGVDMFIGEKQREEYEKNNGNVITIGLDTQTVFYQPNDFFTGQNIQILENKFLNKEIALFLVPLLKIQIQKFSWGSTGATLTRLNRTKILLPIDSGGKPNWQFMEDYVKQEQKIQLQKIVNYYSQRMIECDYDLLNLEDMEWKEFWLEDIVDIKSGVRLTKADQKSGKRPFIGSTDGNNGVTSFVSNINNSLDNNLLGVNYNGSVVDNFYHPYECVFSDDVKRLHFKDKTARNKYCYLFLKQCILKQKSKYTYGYKFKATRMKRQKIILPVDENKNPHWEYMRQFMQKLESEKIGQLINYYNNKELE